MLKCNRKQTDSKKGKKEPDTPMILRWLFRHLYWFLDDDVSHLLLIQISVQIHVDGFFSFSLNVSCVHLQSMSLALSLCVCVCDSMMSHMTKPFQSFYISIRYLCVASMPFSVQIWIDDIRISRCVPQRYGCHAQALMLQNAPQNVTNERKSIASSNKSTPTA